jgi:hypothetical protein
MSADAQSILDSTTSQIDTYRSDAAAAITALASFRPSYFLPTAIDAPTLTSIADVDPATLASVPSFPTVAAATIGTVTPASCGRPAPRCSHPFPYSFFVDSHLFPFSLFDCFGKLANMFCLRSVFIGFPCDSDGFLYDCSAVCCVSVIFHFVKQVNDNLHFVKLVYSIRGYLCYLGKRLRQ